MRRRLLLFSVDALGLESWHMDKNGIVRVAAFAPGEDAAFATWLAGRRRGEACRMVVNLADESFEVEDLPRVRGADRRALHARRLGAWFPRPAFAHAHLIGAAGAGLERVLFSGLNRPEQLEPWREAVLAAGLRLERIVPAAQLIAGLIPPLASPPGHQLLVVFTRAGMRICEVHGKTLHFSRLVGQCTLANARRSTQWTDEIALTRSYILARGRISADTPLAVTVVAPADALAPPPAAPAPPDPAPPPIHFISPARITTLRASDENGAPLADGEFGAALLHGLSRTPAALGWTLESVTGTGLPRLARHRAALLASALVLTGLALGARPWWPPGQRPRDAAATPPPPDLPQGTSPPLLADKDVASPAAPRPEAAAAMPRRIDGILRRPDGRDFIWLDGSLVELERTSLTLVPTPVLSLAPQAAPHLRLHPGDYWPPAGPGPASPAEAPGPGPIRIHARHGEPR